MNPTEPPGPIIQPTGPQSPNITPSVGDPEPAASNPVVAHPVSTPQLAPQAVPVSQPVSPQAAPIAPPTDAATNPRQGSKNTLLIGAAVGGLLLVVAGIITAIVLGQHKSSPTQPTKSNGSTNTPPAASSAPSSTAPKGWVARTTNCFTIMLPSDNDLSPDDKSCLPTVHYGSDQVASFAVHTFLLDNGTLAQNVARWKTNYKTDTILSETPVKLGGYDADKIVHQAAGKYTTPYLTVLVYTGPKYKIGSSTTNGFEIIGGYQDQYSEKILLDQVLANWQWK